MKKLGYLGPLGSFSHVAALQYEKEFSLIPYESFYSILSALSEGALNFGLVPVENSIEGAVNPVLDCLAFDVNLYIIEEFLLTIENHLLIHSESNKEQIQKIISHPQPLGQCRKFLQNNFPNTTIESSSSTAAACKMASQDISIAAIGNLTSASLYNLQPLFHNIQDFNTNQTRFLLLQKEKPNDIPLIGKSSLIFSVSNEPGKLHQILNIFSLWDINMTRIESRPSKNKLGEYVFFIDIEGTISNPDVKDALNMIQRKTNFYKFLGSYISK